MQEVEMGEHISNDRPRPVHQQLRRRRHLQILQKGYSGDIKKEKYHPINRIRMKNPTLIYMSFASIFPARNVFFRLVKILSIVCIFLFPVANHKEAEQHTA